MDTIGTKTIALISEVSLFQGENNMYLYKVGTWSSLLINQVSFFQGCPLRGVPLYACIQMQLHVHVSAWASCAYLIAHWWVSALGNLYSDYSTVLSYRCML